jgi:uncharacterized membrane protein
MGSNERIEDIKLDTPSKKKAPRRRMNKNLKKVIIWRSISFPIATTIAYSYLGELARSITLSVIMVVTLTTVHFIFETLWNKYHT